jgi:hypothetical protein
MAVAMGAFLIALGLLHPLLPMLSGMIDDGQPIETHTVWMGLMLYLSIGTVMVWAGVGSMRRRRWVRPIMLFLSGTWLIVGVFVLLLVLWVLEDMLLVAGGDVVRSSPEVAVVARVLAIGVTVSGGVLLPLLFFWAYRDPGVQTTCERHDPRPCWSDRCPSTVLVLSAALLAAAVFSLPMLLRPVIPLFGRVVTGSTGLAILLIGTALCLWLAWSTFRLERAGWWGTLVFLVWLGISTVWTFSVVELTEIYRELGYPEEQIAALAGSDDLLRRLSLWSTVALTAAGVLYMLGIKRHFARRGASQT